MENTNSRIVVAVVCFLASAMLICAEPTKVVDPTPEELRAAIKAFEAVGGKLERLNDPHTNQTNIVFTLPSGTREDLKRIPTIPFPFGLDLAESFVTDNGLKEVSKFQNLRSLDLFDTKVTDAGIKEIAKLKKLTDLSLFRTRVTDNGLKDLKKHGITKARP